MFGWFKKRFDTPIEQRDYGKLYAGLSILLFLGTLWVVYNEIDSRRPWKDYQEQYKALKVRVLKHRLQAATKGASESKYREIQREIAKINQSLASGEEQNVQGQIDDIAMDIRNLSQERANLKSEADNRNYLFEHSRKEGDIEASDDYRKERTELEGEMAKLDVRIDSLEKLRVSLHEQRIKPLVDRRVALESQRDSIFGQLADLKKKIVEAEAEPIKVKQVMLADFDRSNFGNVKMRADRCMTCHLGVGDPVLADTTIFTKVGKGQVFRTEKAAARARKVFGPHPQSELLEIHGVEKFGCTGCHGGQPMAIDDVEHAHGHQAHWERPLLKGDYVEGSCRKCHGGMMTYKADQAEMSRVSEGRKLFVDFGCYGCHEAPHIPDWTEYKVGPSLQNISQKVSPEWAVRWVLSPESWNEHTRMPNFKFTQQQAEAVVAYLWSSSGTNTYRPASSGVPAGDPARGRQTMVDVGCMACHAMEGFEPRGGFKFVQAKNNSLWPNQSKDGNRVAEGNMFGPDLNKVGSKVSAAWLFDWVKNPKHFSPDSRMPNLRLSDQEAADVTAYLMGRREAGPSGVKISANLADPNLVKEGERLIRDYGCFGCHNIKGMEKEGKVSVSLADFGDKTGADLYFGYLSAQQLFGVRSHFEKTGFRLGTVFEHVSIGEDWFTWTALKMKNSRIFATDAIPQKMPVFNMTDEEAYALTVLLRSYSKAYIPDAFTQGKGVLQPAIDDGRFLVHWNNCVGCHKVEEHGGFVLDNIAKVMGLEGDDVLPYGPPSLNTIGAKAQEDWFYGFVRNPASMPVRTWLKIRMPTYGFTPTEITRLERFFLGVEGEPLQFTDYSFFPASTQTLAAGRELFERLKCQQCHAVGGSPANGGDAAVPAPNLALAGNRLKPEWIARWIRDPQAIVPGTKMPNFFGTLEEPMAPFQDILNGDWQAQINALRDYVWRIGGPKGFGADQPQMASDTSTTAPQQQPTTPPTTMSQNRKNAPATKAGGKLSMK